METNNKDLTSWDFTRDLLKLPAKCRKLTSKTSKEKVREILKKYDFLISYNKLDAERYEKKSQRLEKFAVH